MTSVLPNDAAQQPAKRDFPPWKTLVAWRVCCSDWFGLTHGSPALEPFEVVPFKDHCGSSRTTGTQAPSFASHPALRPAIEASSGAECGAARHTRGLGLNLA